MPDEEKTTGAVESRQKVEELLLRTSFSSFVYGDFRAMRENSML